MILGDSRDVFAKAIRLFIVKPAGRSQLSAVYQTIEIARHALKRQLYLRKSLLLLMPMVHIDLNNAQASTNGSSIQGVHSNRLDLTVPNRFAEVGHDGFGLGRRERVLQAPALD